MLTMKHIVYLPFTKRIHTNDDHHNRLMLFYVVLQDVLSMPRYPKITARWKLIHDVERAMASRGEDESAKRARKKPFRRRWTRADLMHTVLAP